MVIKNAQNHYNINDTINQLHATSILKKKIKANPQKNQYLSLSSHSLPNKSRPYLFKKLCNKAWLEAFLLNGSYLTLLILIKILISPTNDKSLLVQALHKGDVCANTFEQVKRKCEITWTLSEGAFRVAEKRVHGSPQPNRVLEDKVHFIGDTEEPQVRGLL